MRAHDLRPIEGKPDVAVCARCGLKVRYFSGCRNRMMDWAAVGAAEGRFLAMAGISGEFREREQGNCDLIMEASVHVVMRG